MKYTVNTFPNMRGGITDEYRTAGTIPELLAYVDYQDGIATATVFDPYKGSGRGYSPRETVKALAIVDRHLIKLGYTEKED